MPELLKGAIMPAKLILVFLLSAGMLLGQEKPPSMTDSEFREGFAVLSRLGANEPFLKNSPDVHLEPQSLNGFFTDAIYRRLEGNAYFGYRLDEGFNIAGCSGKEVVIEEIRDLTETAAGAAYRHALEMSLEAANYKIKPEANCQIGFCVVGVETNETDRTLPGVMIEAYFRNASAKKSFFIRYGVGSPRGLAAAIQLSAGMLVAELERRNSE
jgi:hypothetical protein